MAIYTKLMAHQKKITEFIRDKEYWGIFADYGTGKTLCALKHINNHKFNRTLVISTKTSIQSTWPREIEEHSSFQYVMLLGHKKKKINNLKLGLRRANTPAGNYHSSSSKPVIFLINLDGVKNIYYELVDSKFDCIIIDESTKIKSPTAIRTKALWKLGSSIPNRGIMTGFPITENLSDAYAQIKFLDKGENFGSSYHAFMNKHFTRVSYRYFPRRNANSNILKKVKPFCIRVTNDVLDLPPKVYKNVALEKSVEQKRLMSEFNDTFQLEFGKVKIDTQYIFAIINKSLQMCDGFIKDAEGNIEVLETPKDEALLEEIASINVKKNKVIIWCSFIFSMKKIKRILKSMGYEVLTLSGKTQDVDKVVRQFQNSKKKNILIAIQKKASASITLTACKHNIYYSNMWSYDERANSEARTRRKGSEIHDNIFYTDLFIKDSVEEKVIECLKKKKNLVTVLKNEFKGLRL